LIPVQPDTVVRWHRAALEVPLEVALADRSPAGRKCVDQQLRHLIFRMVHENRTWGHLCLDKSPSGRLLLAFLTVKRMQLAVCMLDPSQTTLGRLLSQQMVLPIEGSCASDAKFI
jgi:hypothetical protein